MNFGKSDFLGWILPVTAAVLATFGAIKSGSGTSYAFASAVVLLVINERRRSKTITASRIRMVDEKGGIRGLIGWNYQGIEVCVRERALYSNSFGWRTFNSDYPFTSFLFGYKESYTQDGAEKLYRYNPSIMINGHMVRQKRSYSMNFSYDNEADKPDVWISVNREEEVKIEGIDYDSYTMCHSFKLS